VVDALLRLLPVVFGIAAGFTLRRLRMMDHHDGETVFKLVFYVFLPALIFVSLATVDLSVRFLAFPVAAVAIIVAGHLGGVLVARKAGLPPVQRAVVISASMMVNTVFALPFVQALYGADGIARVAAFDVVGTTSTFTWAYYTAARANPGHRGGSILVSRLARSPALYAVAAGLLINAADLAVPTALSNLLLTFGSTTGVVISLGIGILFDPLGGDIRRATLPVGTRLGTALVVGVVMVALFHLEGMDRAILLLIAVAPVSFSSVTFASLENLDVGLATNGLSLSLVTAFALSLFTVFLLVRS
jgi:predicted permease